MKKLLFLNFFILFSIAAQAQCSSPNTAFKSGETLIYDLYFNWKFIWVKVGTASMNITQTVYEGKPSYRTRLITRGSEKADNFFVLRDTLVSYVGTDLVPYYFRKGAEEGKAYRLDETWFSYKQGVNHIRQRHQGKRGDVHLSADSSSTCIYDMLSMLLRARSFDASNFKKGHKIRFLMADGKKCDWQTLVYRGKKTFRIENTSTSYRCLVFSFVEYEDKKEKEVITFYVTDDDNHLPVRLDMFLNFGTAKAYLTGARGIRNPQKAKL